VNVPTVKEKVRYGCIISRIQFVDGSKIMVNFRRIENKIDFSKETAKLPVNFIYRLEKIVCTFFSSVGLSALLLKNPNTRSLPVKAMQIIFMRKPKTDTITYYIEQPKIGGVAWFSLKHNSIIKELKVELHYNKPRDH
jgi:hypothetical protein